MNEWNIQSRAHACEACGQPFADKQPYHTLLFDQPPELRRSDICDACAHKDADARSRAGFISHWQGIYEAPAPVVDTTPAPALPPITVPTTSAPAPAH